MNLQNNIEQRFKLPENFLAEQIVLASMINNSNLIYETVGVVTSDIFFNKNHQEIYISITQTHKNEDDINFLNIASNLAKNKKVDSLIELQEIEKLGRTMINSEVFKEYLYLLIDKFLRRSIIISTLFLLETVASEMTSIKDVLNEFETLFLQLNEKHNIATNNIEVTSLLPSIIKRIENNYHNNNLDKTNGLYSGFHDLDNLLDGFQKSDLIIIASRPSMGKTALVLNIAKNITQNSNVSLAFFSLEMTAEQIAYRILASESQITLPQLRKGNLTTEEWKRIQTAIQNLSRTKLYIDDTPKITIKKLRSKIYQILQSNTELNCIIIDYLQLIEGDVKSDNRYQALSNITRSLKIIAREFNMPLIVLSQLSRNLESRTNKRPILADLRESGCLASQSYVYFHTKNIKISKIPLNTQKIVSVINNNNSVTCSFIKSKSINSNKIFYHLLTESGYYLECSANHKILTNMGWRSLSSLTKKESLACAQTQFQQFDHYKKHQNYFLNIKLDKIQSIYLKQKDTLFDLEVSQNHNFISNRIVVHNSIEQDADVVCMLYREGYYNNEETENQIAEIAVLKHRNGPTGKIELKFNNKFAEFVNKSTP